MTCKINIPASATHEHIQKDGSFRFPDTNFTIVLTQKKKHQSLSGMTAYFLDHELPTSKSK